MKYSDRTLASLSNLNIEVLKPMQKLVLEQYNESENIVLLSPTGSGKTLAFLLPMLDTINQDIKGIQTLILAPSRELAQQIERVFRQMSTGYKVVCCYGGHSIKIEKDQLTEQPTLLIGTPGRVLDHLENGRIDTSSISTLILDEFDKSLEMGFTEEMSSIIARLEGVKKRVLTSATDAEIPEYTGVTNPKKIDFLEESTNIVSGLTLYQVKSFDADKLETLYRLLCETGEGRKLVFCNYRESVERVSEYLMEQGVANSIFHGGMEQPERERSLVKFRNGSANVFVSTDLAARGLDIPEVKHVIHYHLPNSEDAFIHRNGRTARMDNSGEAFLILGPDEHLPEYVDEKTGHYRLSEVTPEMTPSEFVTLYIGKGKRDKISKGDVVGFLCQQGNIEKCDIGPIEVRELYTYVAVKRILIKDLLRRIQGEKIKKMKTKYAIST
ncbi:MAG: DEAD/DEAH box helicase [Bacteroidales bacterium]